MILFEFNCSKVYEYTRYLKFNSSISKSCITWPNFDNNSRYFASWTGYAEFSKLVVPELELGSSVCVPASEITLFEESVYISIIIM